MFSGRWTSGVQLRQPGCRTETCCWPSTGNPWSPWSTRTSCKGSDGEVTKSASAPYLWQEETFTERFVLFIRTAHNLNLNLTAVCCSQLGISPLLYLDQLTLVGNNSQYVVPHITKSQREAALRNGGLTYPTIQDRREAGLEQQVHIRSGKEQYDCCNLREKRADTSLLPPSK